MFMSHCILVGSNDILVYCLVMELIMLVAVRKNGFSETQNYIMELT